MLGGLHNAFPVSLHADNGARFKILYRCRKDLAGRGGVFVHDDRKRHFDALCVGTINIAIRFQSPAHTHDRPFAEQRIRDAHNIRKRTARVIAQVDHKRTHAAVRQVLDRFLEFRGAVAREHADTDIARILIKKCARYARQVERRTGDLKLQRFFRPLERKRHAFPHFPVNGSGHLVKQHAADVLTIHSHDHVPRQNTRFRSRCVIVNIEHRRAFRIRLPHEDADAVVLPVDVGEIVLVFFRCVICRVGIVQRCNNASCSRIQQRFPRRRLLEGIVLHAVDHFIEEQKVADLCVLFRRKHDHILPLLIEQRHRHTGCYACRYEDDRKEI